MLRSASGSPAGPWELAVSPLMDTRHPQRNHSDGTTAYYANPAPLIEPDGRTTLLYRDYWPKAKFPATNRMSVATARSWRELSTSPTFPLGPDGTVPMHSSNSTLHFAEDPHLYRDHRGNCHALFHALDHWGTPRAGATVGGHAFAADCEHFRASPEPAYSATVRFTDGSSYAFQRRERPEAVLRGGEVIALVTGVADGRQGPGDDYSWTLVQPVRTAAPLPLYA